MIKALKLYAALMLLLGSIASFAVPVVAGMYLAGIWGMAIGMVAIGPLMVALWVQFVPNNMERLERWIEK